MSAPDRDTFASRLLEAIRALDPRVPVTYDPQGGRLAVAAGGSLFLRNAFDEYVAARDPDRPGVVARYARHVVDMHARMTTEEPPAGLLDVAEQLLPRVTARTYFEDLKDMLAAQSSADTFPHRVLSEHLAVNLVLDSDESMHLVAQSDLDEWNATFEGAMNIATRNLRAASEEPFRFVAPGLYASPWRDNYDSARLVLRDLIEALPVAGRHVVMAVNRDTLLVTGDQEEAGLAAMASETERLLDQPRLLPTIPVVLDGNAWATYEMPPTNATGRRFQKLRIIAHDERYGRQKERLERHHRENEVDVFVASYTAMHNASTDEYLSYCLWGADIITLLPRAESILFKRDIEDPGIRVPWAKAVGVVGHLMKAQGMVPERWLVEEFPGPAELRALAELAED